MPIRCGASAGGPRPPAIPGLGLPAGPRHRSAARPVLPTRRSACTSRGGLTRLRVGVRRSLLPSQRLLVEDPGEAVFVGSVGLDVSDPFVQLLVLEHRLVRVEADAFVITCLCLIFSQCEEGTPSSVSLMRRKYGDIV